MAPAEETDPTELAKQPQNPVADLISVPFQNNCNFNARTDRDMVWVMNVQPVIPIHLTEDWNPLGAGIGKRTRNDIRYHGDAP